MYVLWFQNRFHLQMMTRTPPSALSELLLMVLLKGGWQGGAAVLCPGGGNPGMLEELEQRGHLGLDGAHWHLWETLNLSRLEENASEDKVMELLSQLLSRTPSAPASSVVLFGSDPECTATVLRSAHQLSVALPPMHWIMGYPLSLDSLHSIGSPLGLLAYGEVNRKPLNFYIRDTLQLIGRAVYAATMVRPDLALIQNMVNCFDKPNKHELPSSGQYLAR